MIAKLLLVYIIGFSSSQRPQRPYQENPPIRQYVEQCAIENQIDLQKENDSLTYGMKCFSKCIAMKLGIVTYSGKPFVNNLKRRFNMDEPQMKNFINCNDLIQERDICERVYQLEKCIENSLENYTVIKQNT